jgi:hypothetical protein
MAETFKIFFILLLNLLLFACGPIVIKRRRVSIGFGRPRPLFTITLTDIGAVIFGIFCIVGGTIAFIPTLVFLFSKDETLIVNWLTIGIAAGIIIMATGFVAGGVVQFALTLEKQLRIETIKRNSSGES